MLLLRQISNFYQRWERLGLKVTFILVSLQVIHLFWLTTFVILNMPELTLYIPPILFVMIDYLELPAIFSGTIFYLLSLHLHKNKKDLLYVGLLLIQIIHIVWITDTFIYMAFNFNQMIYLAWFAIAIDFLEVPVIWDLYKRLRWQREEPNDRNLSER